MRLIELYIKSYKIFNEVVVQFEGEVVNAVTLNSLYGKLNITALVGQNGSGKTTLLSFLASIFHNLERYHGRITSDFRLSYEIDLKSKKTRVQIEKTNKNVWVSVQGRLERSLLLEFRPRADYLPKNFQKGLEGYITFEGFRKFLPSVVITSTFSIHNEYPNRRPASYFGERLVAEYDISNIYGRNHYTINSLSKGILSFTQLYHSRKQAFDKLLEIIGLKFDGRFLIKKVNDNFKLSFEGEEGPDDRELYENDFWLCLSKSELAELATHVNNEDIFINDVEFLKISSDEPITLENMSSGEKMFFVRLFSVLASIKDNSIVILEEPELHLNPAWVKQLITLFLLVFNDYEAHFLIASHSFLFINALNPNDILFLENGRVSHPKFNTLLANEPEINRHFFPQAMNLNNIEVEILKRIDKSPTEELRVMVDGLGESFLKYLAFKKIKERTGDVEDNK